MKYRFDQIAFNSTAKKTPTESDKEHYIGLEHIDSECLEISRWGSEVAPIGEKLIMKKGDVLFGKRRAYQRKLAIAPFDGIFSAHGMVLRPNEEIVDKDFFPFFMSSDIFMERAVQISVGGLSPTINWKDLREQEFDLPPLAEQKVLAEKIWAAYRLKESYKKLLAATEEMVKSQFIEMFAKNDFETVPLGDLCDKISDGSHNPPKGIEKSNYLMISSKNVFKDNLDLTDVRYLAEEDFEAENKRTNVRANDILLTIVGTIGRTYLVKGNEGNLVMQRSVAVLSPNSMVSPLFLMYYLHTDKGLEKEGRGNAQKGVYLKQLSSYEIKVPSIDVQREFEDIYNQADKSEFGGFKSQFIEMFGSVDDNPKSYDIKKVGDFAECFAGATPSTKIPSYWDNGNIPWMSSGEVHKGRVQDTDAKITNRGYDSCSTKMVPIHSIVVALAGQGKT